MEAARELIVYPHRLYLIGTNICDVCESQGSNFLIVKGQPFQGLRICESPDCKKRASRWLDNATIANDRLVNEFGDWVYVRRSSGRKESGWIIEGDAYQDSEDGPFWVCVKDKHRHSKCVTLATLRSWNN